MSGDPTAAVPASHDPMCPIRRETWCIWPGDRCEQCRLIASVRDDERSSNFTPDDHANGMTESYHRGFDDARWIAAKEALEGVQHENCDCGPCQAISRALAELRTIGQG
jgi:hypothetical protein